MRSREDIIDDNAINALTALLAGILVVSPWLLGFRSETPAATSAWVGGALAGIVAIAAMAKLHEWEEWANLVVGLGILISPWLLSFSSHAAAMWMHVMVGGAIAAVSALEIWRLHEPPAAGAV